MQQAYVRYHGTNQAAFSPAIVAFQRIPCVGEVVWLPDANACAVTQVEHFWMPDGTSLAVVNLAETPVGGHEPPRVS